MKIEPEPIFTTVEMAESDRIHRITIRDEEVFKFELSQGWFVSKASITRDRNALVITVERRKDKEEDDGSEEKSL